MNLLPPRYTKEFVCTRTLHIQIPGCVRLNVAYLYRMRCAHPLCTQTPWCQYWVFSKNALYSTHIAHKQRTESAHKFPGVQIVNWVCAHIRSTHANLGCAMQHILYLSGSVGIAPTWWVFGGRRHCCLICAQCVSRRGGYVGYIRKAVEKGYLEHPGSACCTDDMFEIFARHV